MSSPVPRPPFQQLLYLYVGCGDFERDLAWYRDVLGAPMLWNFARFGARVAAFRVGEGPPVLIADHRPAPSCMPIWSVEDLERTAAALVTRGWRHLGAAFEIPDGPCYRYDDPSGNPFAFLQPVRPNALLAAYSDPHNPSAVR